MIREATLADAGAILQIYNHYIANSVATFEEQLITAAEMSARMRSGMNIGMPWYVCTDGSGEAGYKFGRWIDVGYWQNVPGRSLVAPGT